MLKRNRSRERRPINFLQRRTTMFTDAEVRTLSEARGQWSSLETIRPTCPPHLFQQILEFRAAKLGIKHETSDADRRAKAAKVAALIAADEQAAADAHARVLREASRQNF